MALKTLGTNSTTSLQAVQFNHSSGVMSDSDLAAFNALVKPDISVTSGIGAGSGKLGTYVSREGILWIPKRGWIKLSNSDWLCVDSTGWPSVLSGNAVASGPYTHT